MEIMENGDLYLKVGVDLRQVLVSSAIMSLSSSVFKTMLNSQFREGLSNHVGPGKPVVNLPDDDAEGMIILCRIFHHRTEGVSSTMDAKSSKVIAHLSDRYDCLKSIKPWLLMWMNDNYNEAYGLETLYNTLQVTYLLDLPARFTGISLHIMMQDWRTYT